MYGSKKSCLITARSYLWEVVFGAVSLCFLFLYEISREPLNEFAPNSHSVWSLARTSLKVRCQMSRSPETKTALFGSFSGLRAVYVW